MSDHRIVNVTRTIYMLCPDNLSHGLFMNLYIIHYNVTNVESQIMSSPVT